MTAFYILAAILGVLLTVYLVVVLIRPERF